MTEFQARYGGGSLFLWLVGVVLLSSCTRFSPNKAPVVLVLIDAFSEEDYICGDSRHLEGLTHLQEACEELVRFTHVYAPTPMIQPNLSTLMSGEPVRRHRVVNNGNHGLSAQLTTLAEQASHHRMRTGLFSGGVPLVKKFGLSQGFEEFNDPLQMSQNLFLRPAHKTFARGLQWLDREVENRSFLMTFYLPDLLYRDLTTENNLGDERPVGRDSGVREIHESIDFLIGELKARKQWRDSLFVILGTTGQNNSLVPINPLGGYRLHVPLQVKTPSKYREQFVSKTDTMLSFSAIGQWLQAVIQAKKGGSWPSLPGTVREDWIPQQDGLPLWKSLTSFSHNGIRNREYLFAYTPNLQVFESQLDRKEIEKLSQSEAEGVARSQKISIPLKRSFSNFCDPETLGCRPKMTEDLKLRDLSELVNRVRSSVDSQANIAFIRDSRNINKNQPSDFLSRWVAYQSLIEKNWSGLFELGKIKSNKAWMLVAQLNLRESPSAPVTGCLQYFVDDNRNMDSFYKYCRDTRFRKVLEGITRLRNKKNPGKHFRILVNDIKNQRLARRLNLKMFFVNDIKYDFDFSPELAELYFFLPENREYLSLIDVN